MKTQYIVLTAIIILTLVIGLLFVFTNPTIKNNDLVNKIRDESYLDILVNLGNFSKDNYDESKLLSVSMQLAEKLGLLNESSGDNYIQYVSGSDLNLLIYELTGITIEAPIEIEDFYYLYDGENEYYYFRPVTPVNYTVKEIKSIKEKSLNYDIVCLLSMTEDLEEITVDNVEVSLTNMPKNNLIKYRVNEVKY